MQKLYLLLSLMGISSICLGQAQNEHVTFSGKIFNMKDSSAVVASLLYEKLPYYDDMGRVTSDERGSYEFLLFNNTKYNFKISGEGYQPFEEQIKVTDTEGTGQVTYDFYIQPDEEPELITLENLIFARGSDRITESSYQGLDELVNWLNERPGLVIQLEGHTDFAGNADANMRLSQARVVAVKEYLTDQGIKKKRVLTKAFGGTQPLSKERTDEAKRKNRRVEVRVIKKAIE